MRALMKGSGSLCIFVLAWLLASRAGSPLAAQELETSEYTLLPGSVLVDDCLDCDRIPIERPLQGSFLVTLEAIGDFTDWHTIHDLELRDLDGGYVITGGGEFTTHYTVPLSLGTMSLELAINGQEGIQLESGEGESSGPFPALDVRVGESGERDPLHVYTLRIVAAPETDLVPYVLDKESYFLDDCTICGRPTIQVPIEGTFLLGELYREFNPAAVYRLDDLEIRSTGPMDYRITGAGFYSRWNAPVPGQQMTLEVLVNDGRAVSLASTEDVQDPPPFPDIEIRLRAELPESFLVYTLHLRAHPAKLPAVPFVRGDVNDDGEADIADAVAILFHLFVGTLQPGCLKSVDVDDSGQRDVTDALALLGYLFLAWPAPASPFGTCGEDPTPDLLSCERFTACP